MTGSLPLAAYEILALVTDDKKWPWNHPPQWLIWSSVGLALFCAQFFAWRDLSVECARLREKAPHLVGHLREAKDRILLDITNQGGPADVWAQLRLTGSIIAEPTDAYAAWGHITGERTTIANGETLNVEIALRRPLAAGHLWCVQLIQGSKRFEEYSRLISSGGPLRHAPLTVEIEVFSIPTSAGAPIRCRLMVTGSEWKPLSEPTVPPPPAGPPRSRASV